MEKSPYTSEEIARAYNTNILLYCFLILLAFMVGFLLIELSVFKPKVTCTMLSSIQEAKAELRTHPELDKNRDGKPCEAQFPNQ